MTRKGLIDADALKKDLESVTLSNGTMMNHNLIVSKNAIEIVKGGGNS